MRVALALAVRGLGSVWPNPAVGCVLVNEERVVGRGWTRPGGRPHAETEAVSRAGAGAKGATAFVSLEPCNHHGETPPCTEALIEAGIARCVIALTDPDSRVSGQGIKRLADAGVAVVTGVLAPEAASLNAGYLKRVRDRRPLITWKVASSLDGRIATGGGHSQWITGELARRRAHLLRAEHDAVLIGSHTAIVDRPRLTCRLAGLEARSPVRVIADSRLQLPLTDPLVAEAGEAPTWILTLAGADKARKEAYRSAGVEVIEVPAEENGRLDLTAALIELGGRGLTRVMVEGGGRLAASLLGAGLIDRIEWFRAPAVIGGDGIGAAAALGLDRVDRAPRFERIDSVALGEDVLESYVALA
jgi:diaminohydroxyphosphoribosylaminopyrimidine deaminase/5-amino-6-(5-phosphoribosylamino)uracil reductase